MPNHANAEGICSRCKTTVATVKRRTEMTCQQCFEQYVSTKVVKRLALLRKDSRPAGWHTGNPQTPKYLIGLSFGPSSTALIHMLDQSQARLMAKRTRNVPTIIAVHVNTTIGRCGDPSSSPRNDLLDGYRDRFPRIKFEAIPLESVFDIETINWSLFSDVRDIADPSERLQKLLAGLSEPTAAVDISRLFVRHVLTAAAGRYSCDSLLLGCTTTALAEQTFSAVAKGRGFSVPWQVNDGQVRKARYASIQSGSEAEDFNIQESESQFQVFYPLQDIFRSEIVRYAKCISPPLDGLILFTPEGAKNVVSHKDLSIDDVVSRYFEEAEGNYQSVVANVVRTSSRLNRVEGGESCGLCGMVADEQGDSRWRGEICEAKDSSRARKYAGKLCYGCERSLYGS